jgi:surface antigen
MKRNRLLRLGILASLVVTGLGSSGCTTPGGTPNNTGTDALAGGALGAGAGALLGAAAHAPVAGALIGGALGAGTGAAIGSNQDRTQAVQANANAYAQAQAVQAQQRITPPQVVDMVSKGVDEANIINQVRQYGCAPLSTDDLVYLQQCRVSPRVIAEMQAAAQRPPAVVYGPPPGYYYRRPYGYYPYP